MTTNQCSERSRELIEAYGEYRKQYGDYDAPKSARIEIKKCADAARNALLEHVAAMEQRVAELDQKQAMYHAMYTQTNVERDTALHRAETAEGELATTKAVLDRYRSEANSHDWEDMERMEFRDRCLKAEALIRAVVETSPSDFDGSRQLQLRCRDYVKLQASKP